MMMKLLLIVSTLLISVYSRNCGRPKFINGKPQPYLALLTTSQKNIAWEGTNGVLLANVFAGGRWQRWQIIDTRGCDDFKPGAWSFFEDFSAVKQRWEAIAIYTCSNDGVLLEQAGYWNGVKQDQTVGWEPSVFGPFGTKCVYNAYSMDQGGDKRYSDILVDGDTDNCDGLIWRTGDPQKVGRVWAGKLPGTPNCGILRGKKELAKSDGLNNFMPEQQPVIPDNNTSGYTQFEQQLLNYLMGVIGIALLLFVSNSCLMAYAIKNKNGRSSNYYGKVAQTDIE